MEKNQVQNPLHPPGQKMAIPPPPLSALLKGGNILCLPISMAKTSSFREKTTLKCFLPPLQHGLNSFSPPPFRRGKLHPPPTTPVFPPPPLHVISDHSLTRLSAYVIISGEPPCHAGSGSKQTHVVHSEPMGTHCKHWNISINIQFLSIKTIGVIHSNIFYVLSAFQCFRYQ